MGDIMLRQEMVDKINKLSEEKRDLKEDNKELKTRLKSCSCPRSDGLWVRFKALWIEKEDE